LNSISHELRTPLAASTSAASALASADAATLEQRRALLDEILEANARLNRVVGNLLDVARLESGKVRPHLDWHDARRPRANHAARNSSANWPLIR